VLSTITVIHRIRYTYQQTRGMAPVSETEPIVLRNAAREAGTESSPATTSL
jgi:hypothetical protein